MTRREFIITLSRYGIVAGLVLMSGYMLFRKKTDEVCDLEFVCKSCKKQKTCNLPEAKKANTEQQ